MNLYHDGNLMEDDQLVRLAQNHGVELEDAEYLVECLREGSNPDIKQYEQVRDGQYIKCVAAFISKVDGGASIPPVTRGEVSGEIMAVVPDLPANAAIDRMASVISDALSPWFDLDENGRWHISPDRPPTIQEAYKAAKFAVDLKAVAGIVADKADWTLCNLIEECEMFFGEAFNISQVAELSELSPGHCSRSLRTYKWTQEHGKFNLPMTTHTEVICSEGLDDEKKRSALEVAEKHQLTQKEARYLRERLVDGAEIEALDAETRAEVRQNLKAPRKSSLWIASTNDKHWLHRLPYGEAPTDDWAVNLSDKTVWVNGKKRELTPGDGRRHWATIKVDE